MEMTRRWQWSSEMKWKDSRMCRGGYTAPHHHHTSTRTIITTEAKVRRPRRSPAALGLLLRWSISPSGSSSSPGSNLQTILESNTVCGDQHLPLYSSWSWLPYHRQKLQTNGRYHLFTMYPRIHQHHQTQAMHLIITRIMINNPPFVSCKHR